MIRISTCVSVVGVLYAGEALAQDTKYVDLRTCSERPTNNDPTIVVRKKVTAQASCGDGRPIAAHIVDNWYGFEVPLKTVRDVRAAVRRITPTPVNVFLTHKPCRIGYPSEGVLVEWLVPRGASCEGLPQGSFHRVFTPDGELCIRPGGGCVKINELSPVAQKRFGETLRIAYQDR